jgi:hypothetical protein
MCICCKHCIYCKKYEAVESKIPLLQKLDGKLNDYEDNFKKAYQQEKVAKESWEKSDETARVLNQILRSIFDEDKYYVCAWVSNDFDKKPHITIQEKDGLMRIFTYYCGSNKLESTKNTGREPNDNN